MEIEGIYPDHTGFRIAHLRASRHGVEILGLRHVKSLYNPETKGKIVSGLQGSDLIIKNISLKIPKNRFLQEALRFQLETNIYLNIEDILPVSMIQGNKLQTTDVTFFIPLKEVIREHLKQLASCQVIPDRVSAAPQALLRYTLWKRPDLKKGILIDLGATEWCCVYFENKQIKKTFSFNGGMKELFDSLWEDRKKMVLQKEVEGIAKQIDLLQLKSHLNPHLSEKLEKKRKEIAKAVFSILQHSEPCLVAFTGHTNSFVHIREFLAQDFEEAPIHVSQFPLSEEEDLYAISIGLALEEVGPNKDSIQFLRGEFFPKKLWKKSGLYATLIFSISLLMSFFFCFWSKSNYQEKGAEIVHSIELLLNKNNLDLKKEILTENASPKEVLNRWTSFIDLQDKAPKIAVLAPKVAEVLTWLDHHPLIKTFKEMNDPIHLHEFRYRLVNYPKIGSLNEKYKAQIEFFFSIQNAMNARKLHEALLKGDDMIDPTQPIGWEALSNGYRVTCGLKNKDKNVF